MEIRTGFLYRHVRPKSDSRARLPMREAHLIAACDLGPFLRDRMAGCATRIRRRGLLRGGRSAIAGRQRG